MFKLSLLSLSFAIFSSVSAQQPEQFQAGLHYDVLAPSITDPDSEEQVIHEFFSYSCGGCAQFEPLMERIQTQHESAAKIVKVPVVFNPTWEVTARTYYTAEAMGLLDRSHQAFFDAIHQQGKKFRKIEDVAQWFAASFGTDADAFISTSQSFAVDSRLREAQKLTKKAGVARTPTIVVNGKYRFNSSRLNGQTILQLVDHLIK